MTLESDRISFDKTECAVSWTNDWGWFSIESRTRAKCSLAVWMLYLHVFAYWFETRVKPRASHRLDNHQGMILSLTLFADILLWFPGWVKTQVPPASMTKYWDYKHACLCTWLRTTFFTYQSWVISSREFKKIIESHEPLSFTYWCGTWGPVIPHGFGWLGPVLSWCRPMFPCTFIYHSTM